MGQKQHIGLYTKRPKGRATNEIKKDKRIRQN